MKLLLQRVKEAQVRVAGERVAAIRTGLLVFVGFGVHDGPELPGSDAWDRLLKKTFDLRIFPDKEGRLNESVRKFWGEDGQVQDGEILLVSQFTLYADCRKGRRPSFQGAAESEIARGLFSRLVKDMETLWPGKVRAGLFGAEMDVSLVNWGPVTILLTDAHLQNTKEEKP